MKQSTGRARRVWFWIGVALLSINALFWLIFIPIIAEDPDLPGILLLIFLTAPLVGIGIYGVRRGRKAPAVEVQRVPEPAYTSKPAVKPSTFKGRKVTVQGIPNGSEIVIKMPVWFRVVAWFELLALPPVGIWMVGMTTKITFNQLTGYMTVTRGHIPPFLWFLRTKRISRDETRSVFVRSVKRTHFGAYTALYVPSTSTYAAYELKVITSSGKEVKLYDGGTSRDAAD